MVGARHSTVVKLQLWSRPTRRWNIGESRCSELGPEALAPSERAGTVNVELQELKEFHLVEAMAESKRENNGLGETR